MKKHDREALLDEISDLSPLLEQGGDEPRAYALLAHCFGGDEAGTPAARLARALQRRGFGVLRVALPCAVDDAAAARAAGRVDDLVRAAAALRARGAAPALLVGHSGAGAALLVAASSIPEARAVATINAPADPAALAAAADPGRALLLCHAPRDEVVGIDAARRLYEAATHPKSFVSLDDMDHLLSRAEDAEYVADVVAAWSSRYVPRREVESTPLGEPRRVVVEESHLGRYAQAVRAGPHVVAADEPQDVGGQDLGPSPYELLLASLGACTSMTMRMYADRKGWPLQHVAVRLQHDKVHAADCAACETKEGRVDRIRRSVEMHGPLDDEQRERLLEIADRCPVHRTLAGEIVIETREEEG